MAAEDRPLRFLDPDAKDFTEVVDNLAIEPRLALDTESDPFHRYYEKVCLVQISTPTSDWYLDPLAHGLPDPLRALFQDERRLLVLHGADYDVRALKKAFGLTLGRLFDTSVAAQVLGLPAVGLKALLEAELGVVIDKGEQRSDWAKRPLSSAQLEYAREDTRHLLALADRLIERLEAAGRLPWVEEECALLRTREPIEKIFDPNDWKRVKGSKSLKMAGRQVLRAAFVWRERTAQARDVPPFRVMRNDVLLRLAQRIQKDRRQLDRLDRIRFLPKGLDLADLRRAVRDGLAGEDPARAKSRDPGRRKDRQRLDKEGQRRLERLKAGRTDWAAALQIDPGFLISGSVLGRIAAANPKTPKELGQIEGMTAWRVAALSTPIFEALRL